MTTAFHISTPTDSCCDAMVFPQCHFTSGKKFALGSILNISKEICNIETRI